MHQEGELVEQVEVEKRVDERAVGVDADRLDSAVAEDLERLGQVDLLVSGDELAGRRVGRSRGRLIGVQGEDVGPVAELP